LNPLLAKPFAHLPPRGPGRITARQRVCAQWRRVDLVPLEKALDLKAQSAGAILPKVLATLRMERRRSEAEIVKVWNQLLAPDIIAHAQPTGIYKGTLFVTVDSSAWLCEILRYRRKEILDRLQHSFGREFIAKISFRAG
jgi:predicted nucleic acid-binding Zn ribbon protein